MHGKPFVPQRPVKSYRSHPVLPSRAGHFCPAACADIPHSYKGRDPRTGAAVAVKPKRLPFFRANYKLKELLNPSVTRTQDLPAVPEDRQRGQPRAGLRTAQE